MAIRPFVEGRIEEGRMAIRPFVEGRIAIRPFGLFL